MREKHVSVFVPVFSSLRCLGVHARACTCKGTKRLMLQVVCLNRISVE
jgi:hypothetical protein